MELLEEEVIDPQVAATEAIVYCVDVLVTVTYPLFLTGNEL